MNKKWKKYALGLTAVLGFSFMLAACDTHIDERELASSTIAPTTQTPDSNPQNTFVERDIAELVGGISFDTKQGALANQLALPEAGEEFAVIHTNFGEIHVRLFPELAPLAVENFITHAKNGYYDGLIFHRIIEDFMIQGGDPTGTGAGGRSIWGTGFGSEVSPNLRHIRGALSMAKTPQPMSNLSQFFIVQNSALNPNETAQMEFFLENQDVEVEDLPGYYGRDLWPAEFMLHYLEFGGTPHLDFDHTVFGQVFIGMDVVDTIAAVQTGNQNRPVNDVIIERIEILRK